MHAVVSLSLLVASTVVAACGAGLPRLAVELTSDAKGAASPGDTPTFTVTVRNSGPGSASGVTVHADLPAGFRYKSTTSFAGSAVRTQPVDAAVNSQAPVWGIWNLARPGDSVTIVFVATADGKPGTYNVVARGTGDNTEGEIQSSPLTLQLAAAPRLSLAVSVSPGSVTTGGEVTYRVSLTNEGSGTATGVAILVTLPPIFAYSDTVQPFGGNSSRDHPTDPVKGTLLVYYSGFNIPAHSSGGPGLLLVAFKASVLKNAGAVGTYTVGVQITDDQSDRLVLNDSSPVRVS